MKTETPEFTMATEPKTQSVKLRTGVVKSARIIIAHEGGKTLTDFLSDILEPLLTKKEEEIRERWAKAPKGKGGQK